MFRRYPILLFFVLTLAVVCLSGCLQVDIEMGIDELYNSYLSYSIAMDVSTAAPEYHEILKNALQKLGWHYQEMLGFTVGINTETDEYTLIMRKRTANDNLPDAFESLKTMLTDESMSIFSQVDMFFKDFERRDSFVIGGVLDIDHMLRLSGFEQLPADLTEALENGISASGGDIVLTVPASEVDFHSHDINKQYRTVTMAVPLDFYGQTVFDLKSSVVYTEDGIQTGTVEDITGQLAGTKTIVISVCLGVLALLGIILLVRVVKIWKYNRLFDI